MKWPRRQSLAGSPATRSRLLIVLYLGAAIVMFVNGIMSHRQTLQQYEEEQLLN